jgi:peptidoglycan-N-acetylglucosamine deacetylase
VDAACGSRVAREGEAVLRITRKAECSGTSRPERGAFAFSVALEASFARGAVVPDRASRPPMKLDVRPRRLGPMSATLPTRPSDPRAGSRIVLLDAMRSVSIARVVLVHVFIRFEHPAFVLFTFLLPGMPIVFAVSGALSYAALSKDRPGATIAFLKSRARRLLFPFWTYAIFAVVLLLVVEARNHHAWHDVDHSELWRWVVPIVEPAASPSLKSLALHLWFVPPFVFLLATAPLTVRLHRRIPWLGLLVFLAVATAVELLAIDVPSSLRTTLLFGVAFQLGFGLTDGSFAKLRVPLLLGGAALLFAAGVAWHQRAAPGTQLNAVPLAHVLVGLAYLPLWLVVKEPVVQAFEGRFLAAASLAVNRRAYTLFLWGPGAIELAWRLARHVPASLWLFTYFLATAVLLVLVAWIFGRVEDRAARRA